MHTGGEPGGGFLVVAGRAWAFVKLLSLRIHKGAVANGTAEGARLPAVYFPSLYGNGAHSGKRQRRVGAHTVSSQITIVTGGFIDSWKQHSPVRCNDRRKRAMLACLSGLGTAMDPARPAPVYAIFWAAAAGL